MSRADDEVSVGPNRRQMSVHNLGRRRVIRVQRITGRWIGAEVEAGQVDIEGEFEFVVLAPAGSNPDGTLCARAYGGTIPKDGTAAVLVTFRASG